MNRTPEKRFVKTSHTTFNCITDISYKLNYDYYAGKVQQLFDEIGTGNFDNVDIDSVRDRIVEFYNAEVSRSVKKLRKDMHATYDYIRTDADLDYRYINTDRNIPICGEEWFDITFGTSYDNAFENFVDYFDKRNEYLEGEFEK